MKKITTLAIALLCSSMLFAQSKAVNPKAIGPLKITAGDGMLAGNDIVKNIGLSKDLSTFYDLINKSNLAVTLQRRGPITVFVPANQSFQNLPNGKLDSLMLPTHVWELTGIISYHAIPGRLKAKDIEKEISKGNGLAKFTTLSGSKLMAKIDANRNIVLIDENGGESIINRFDVEKSNGMLHVVNKVLMPKPKVI